jgi:2-deoxy-D-gluconate 3-dehydrogenase
MAIALAEAGASVIIVGSSIDSIGPAYEQLTKLGFDCLALGADMTSRQEVDTMIDQALKWKGRIDILVNNAGTIRRSPAADFSDDDWDTVIEVNLNAQFRICRAIGKYMISQGSGKIINIASLLSFSGGITVPAYAASKGGIAQLTKALANEWGAHGIQVNAIAPGYFETDNTQAIRDNATRFSSISDRIPAGRWGKPEDLAGPIIFLASSASDYVNGHIMLVDGGWMAR